VIYCEGRRFSSRPGHCFSLSLRAPNSMTRDKSNIDAGIYSTVLYPLIRTWSHPLSQSVPTILNKLCKEHTKDFFCFPLSKSLISMMLYIDHAHEKIEKR